MCKGHKESLYFGRIKKKKQFHALPSILVVVMHFRQIGIIVHIWVTRPLYIQFIGWSGASERSDDQVDVSINHDPSAFIWINQETACLTTTR